MFAAAAAVGAGAAATSMSSYTEDTPVPFFGRPLFAGLAPTSTSDAAHVDFELGDSLPNSLFRRFFTYSSTWVGGLVGGWGVEGW